MSDDSDFDDVAHEKLLQSIKTPGSVKQTKLKKAPTKKIDATSLLSHITVARTSTNEAKKSLGIGGIEDEKGEGGEEKTAKKRKLKDKNEEKAKKKKLKSKTLIPIRDIEARKRIEGEIAFKDLKKEVTKSWTPLVQTNRVADQLIFPLTQPDCLLWGDEKNEPELTKEEIAIKKATDIKLAKEKLKQMQRMRAIIGITEAKNRYLKKIKSKGYHRILKREKRKQLLKEFDDLVTRDPEAAHKKLEELDLQRVMERGSLKHRGQNQKFKQMLEKHASRNPEVKKILEEHLRMGRELKQKVSMEDDDDDDDEGNEVESKKSKKSIHQILQDAANEAAKEPVNVGKALVDSFLGDSEAQKISLAEMRAKKRREAAELAKNVNNAEQKAEPLFDVETNWDQTSGEKKAKKKNKRKNEQKEDDKKDVKKKKGSIAKMSFVSEDYDPDKELELTYEEKVDLAVEEAGVNDHEKLEKEIAIDPRKFLELNSKDLTQVSSDLVEKMDQFDEETANVINEAFKDDDVVGEFETNKDGVKEKEKVKDIDLNLAGWGSWVGPGMTEKKRRKNFIIKAKEKKRKDGLLNGVIIKESVGPSEGIGKIQPRSLPFPYTRVEDYQAVLQQPLGLEWNMEKMRDELCKPAVVVEAGRAIRPINKKLLMEEKNLGMNWCLYLFQFVLLAVGSCLAEVIVLDSSNFDKVLKENELVFVNFYADWCRFSQMLKPIFAEASTKFDGMKGKVAFASLDADKHNDISMRYHVNKYPTLKLFRDGEVSMREYRSSRSVEAFTDYINKQMQLTLKTFNDKAAMQTSYNPEKSTIYAYFRESSGVEFENLKKVSQLYRDDCDFLVGIGEQNFPGDVMPAGQTPKLLFQPSNKVPNPTAVSFSGDFQTYEYLKQWIADRCVPLVREITFQNAEELTEEGLPFLILFKHPDDKTSEKEFTDAVIREIPDQKKAVNCLVADGKKFAHPLHHLGKSEGDLPVIAIDSFRHMYLFNNYNDIHVQGKLRQFVLDLHSGKLHREFHHGPDKENQPAPETQPPPSVFEKLKPASSRYTLLDKTEL
ncbi:unnamed protein product [Caenorhabditis bovis]|uniref:Thioredoxin domain-containing protein n=1 Tax=Caenorhabditis bovis TaxID=2654633 RepID=A0A8S1FB34_9PELO|nr:unnamed protein product [Caenorhabditis bovis]